MKVPQAGLRLLQRGVWLAPWVGAGDEVVLLTVTSERKLLIPPTVLISGSSPFPAFDSLWALLDSQDPVTEHDVPIRHPKLRAV